MTRNVVGDRLEDGYAVVIVVGDLQAEVSRGEHRLRLVRIGPQGGRYVFVSGNAKQARDVSVVLSLALDALGSRTTSSPRPA